MLANEKHNSTLKKQELRTRETERSIFASIFGEPPFQHLLRRSAATPALNPSSSNTINLHPMDVVQ